MDALGPGRILKPVGKQRFTAWEVASEGKVKLVEQLMPWPQQGEVLVRVRAFGLSGPDAEQRRGTYIPPVGVSSVLGQELAGEVVAVGSDVEDWTEGDRLCCLVSGGACAEYCICPAQHCLGIPEGFTWHQAAAIPLAAATTVAFLFDQGEMQHGQSVMIHGAAGGVGHVMTQVAKAKGLRVVASCASSAKADFCRKLGADLVVDRSTDDLLDKSMDYTKGRGVDVIVDVGGVSPDLNLRCLALQGKLLQLAVPGEGDADKGGVNLRQMFEKQITITGWSVRSREPKYRQHLADAVRSQIWPLLESRKVLPHISKKIAFSDVPDALNQLDRREVIGKIVCMV